MVSCFSAVEYGPLFYRKLELAKIQALNINCGNYDAVMPVTSDMAQDLSWWIDNLKNQKRHISHGNPDMVITSDASLLGWGASSGQKKIGGRWKSDELKFHINYLELLAIFLSLKAFCTTKNGIHVQLKTDNVCAMSYLNSMGGTKSVSCNAHVPGILNVSDILSRKFNDNVEWMLNKDVFSNLLLIWGEPDRLRFNGLKGK